jgi:hypothetical protein
MSKELTLEDLRTMPANHIFDYGYEPALGVWVAVRGGIPDWAVYHNKQKFLSLHDAAPVDLQEVADHGNKVWEGEAIRLTGADKEAAAWYRK